MPLVDELTEHAANDPQYDWQYLYALEYAKLRCMRAYFSHSLIADEDGNFGFNRWIDTCVNLLQYIKDDDLHISQAQIKQMNIRNVRDIVPSFIVDAYEETPMPSREEDSVYKKRVHRSSRRTLIFPILQIQP